MKPESRRHRTPARTRIAAGLAWRVRLSQLSLTWERLWPATWPLVGIAGLFVAMILLDLLPGLPAWIHIAILIAFAVGFSAALILAVRGWRWPSLQAARRRLEVSSGILHRPLMAMEDSLALGSKDAAARDLFEAHKRWLATQVARIRVGWPRAGLARVDPFGMRIVVALLLFIGVFTGSADWQSRLAGALIPPLQGAASTPPTFNAWINPPAYTGLAPLFLDRGNGGTLEVPTGSGLMAQVQGGSAPPTLSIGTQEVTFSELSPGTYQLSRVLSASAASDSEAGEPDAIGPGNSISVQQDGQTLAQWPLRIFGDLPPEVEFSSAPSRTERASLRLPYIASDDYGITALRAQIQRLDTPEENSFELELVLPAGGPQEVEGSSYHDLTAHPWAGIAVEISLIAVDAIDQGGKSEPVRTVLPERIFNHPVARALVELRKQLTLAPDDRTSVAGSLEQLADRPDHYFNDLTVALSLFTAARRLLYDRSPGAVPSVQQILWDTALRLEEGEMAIAERDLREAQQALMEALARDASDEEIGRLIDDLEQALEAFLDAMAERLQEQLAQGDTPQQLPPDAQMLERSDLQELLDQARELAQNGMRDAARDLLAQLQEMLENLRAQPFAQGMSQEMQEAQSMMRDLEHMLQRQQQLLDRSFQRSQNRPSDEAGRQQQQQESRSDAGQQESLRRALGELMRQLGDMTGEIPKPLGRAEQEMRSARDALEGENHSDAVRPQTRSMDQLQQGMQAMTEQFMQMFGAQPDRGQGEVGARPGFGNDPLGRSTGQGAREAIEGVEIPDQMEIQRTREILDELRRRRGDRSRPDIELDYIDRLLRQF